MKIMSEELKKYKNVMEYLFHNIQNDAHKNDDIVSGTVIGRGKMSLYVDIGQTIGAVFGRDFLEAKETIKNLRAGDKVIAKILDFETPEGYIALSLKEASKDVVWREIEEIKNQRTVITTNIKEANKGGLILEWKGFIGFLPTSNLKAEHYPRVEGGDKDKILEELKKFVGKPFEVIITDINHKENSLIFSEKGVKDEGTEKILSKYKVDDIVEGEISGIVDFGIFIKIDEKVEGLVHISELDWSLVGNPSEKFKIGDKIKAKIIDIDNNKISLSVKSLQTDPWEEIKEGYNKGDIVKGVVIRFNKHGALISVKEGVAGLVHISQFGDEKNMKNKLELGKSYLFQITHFSPQEHRLTFNYIEDSKN